MRIFKITSFEINRTKTLSKSRVILNALFLIYLKNNMFYKINVFYFNIFSILITYIKYSAKFKYLKKIIAKRIIIIFFFDITKTLQIIKKSTLKIKMNLNQ